MNFTTLRKYLDKIQHFCADVWRGGYADLNKNQSSLASKLLVDMFEYFLIIFDNYEFIFLR